MTKRVCQISWTASEPAVLLFLHQAYILKRFVKYTLYSLTRILYRQSKNSNFSFLHRSRTTNGNNVKNKGGKR